jgi:hypothetical protein
MLMVAPKKTNKLKEGVPKVFVKGSNDGGYAITSGVLRLGV